MNSITSIVRYCGCLAAAGACAAVLALRPPQQQETTDAGRAPLETAYLDCARIASASLREPDLVTLCSVVADTLLHRGFGADLERQLQWWKTPEEDRKRIPAAPAAPHRAAQAAG